MRQNNMKIDLPENVSFIINEFFKKGYEAYAVGGCVRDSLLGKIPYDWDICTNATPDEVEKIFKNQKIIKTGIKHGTVTLLLENIPYEITTYRTDGIYLDNRRPESIEFVKNLNEDLKRRDFTINAMAYNKFSELVDLFGGSADLQKKIIKCVGEPDKRFFEDALRIMRAIRFSATLSFEIEENTKKSIKKNRHLLKNIAKERVNTEFSKALLSDNANFLKDYKDVLEVFLPEAKKFSKSLSQTVQLLKKDIITRLSCIFICTDTEVSQCIKTLKDLKYDSKTVTGVISVLDNYNTPKSPDIKTLCHLLSKTDFKTLKRVFEIKVSSAKVLNDHKSILEHTNTLLNLSEIEKNKCCIKICDLSIDGNDLIESGIPAGEILGRILDELLYLVIEEKLKNTKDALINCAKKLYKTEE